MEEPEQWQLLADGYCAAGCSEAAIALVTDKLGGLGKAHERYGGGWSYRRSVWGGGGGGWVV